MHFMLWTGYPTTRRPTNLAAMRRGIFRQILGFDLANCWIASRHAIPDVNPGCAAAEIIHG